ncbi:MAG TPA: hypothetical protein V6C89_04120 [Drouetiella sp.]|jgi:hypothetical protein
MDYAISEEDDERLEQILESERNQAHKILMDSGFVERVVFSSCMIPLQIDAFLKTGEMCYGRNSRVGGDVTMWVFEKACDLAQVWPPTLFEGKRQADAKDYCILAQEMLVLIKEYLEQKR